jgi:uncharacterized integral membrane protein
MRPRLRRSDEELAQQTTEGAPAEEGSSEFQPRLWLKLLLLIAVIVFVIAFVLENRRHVQLHFVFGSSHVSLIWLILLSIGLGLVGGVLISQLYRRRRRRH